MNSSKKKFDSLAKRCIHSSHKNKYKYISKEMPLDCGKMRHTKILFKKKCFFFIFIMPSHTIAYVWYLLFFFLQLTHIIKASTYHIPIIKFKLFSLLFSVCFFCCPKTWKRSSFLEALLNWNLPFIRAPPMYLKGFCHLLIYYLLFFKPLNKR